MKSYFHLVVRQFKVNDVIFPSGCEPRAFNLGIKNMKIGIFTGATSVRSKNIFTIISQYPTRKHEIKKLVYQHLQHSQYVFHHFKDLCGFLSNFVICKRFHFGQA